MLIELPTKYEDYWVQWTLVLRYNKLLTVMKQSLTDAYFVGYYLPTSYSSNGYGIRLAISSIITSRDLPFPEVVLG